MSKRSIISVFVIILAFLLGPTTETGFSLGDRILLDIGINPWSNGQNGFHISTMVFLVIILVGIINAKQEISGRKLIAMILLLIFLSPVVISLSKPVYYKMQTGLACIEYEPKGSRLEIKSLGSQNLEITGELVLINNGLNPIETGIKIPENNKYVWSSDDYVLTGTEGSDITDKFMLMPGEKRNIIINTVVSLNKRYNGHGSIGYPNIILFTENDTRILGRNL